MTISIDIPAQDLAALKQVTNLQDDAEAVVWAMREMVRIGRLRELKTVSGRVDFGEADSPAVPTAMPVTEVHRPPLSDEDRDLVISLLTTPPKANAALQKAAKEHRDRHG